MAKDNNLSDLIKNIASSIKYKIGISDNINPQSFSSKIVEIISNRLFGASIKRSKKNNITFGDNSDIISLRILSDVESIKEGAFDDFTSLKNLYVYCDRASDKKTINIGSNNSIFSNCPLEKVKLEKKLVNNSNEEFQNWGSAQVINAGSESFTDLTEYLTNIANTIREITDTDDLINPQDFYSKIDSINPEDDSGFYIWSRHNSPIIFGEKGDIINLYLTSKISAIKSGEFLNYTGLEALTIEESNSSLDLGYGSDVNSSAFEKCPIKTLNIYRPITLRTTIQELIPKHTLRSLTIDTSYQSIPEKFFYGQTHLREIILNNVYSIGKEAFSNCGTSYSGETTLSITGATISTIGEKAFYNSNVGGEVKLNSSISEIGISAFEDCSKITRVYFDCSSNYIYFKTLHNLAFAGCVNLERFDFPKTVSGGKPSIWEWSDIGGAHSKSGDSPFYECYSLKILVFPDNLESIPSHLLSTTSTSGGWANNLKYVKMPKDLKNIEEWAFDGSVEGTEFDFSSSTRVPELVDRSFSGYNYSKIIVPDNLYTEWCNSTTWNYFASRGKIFRASTYTFQNRPDDLWGEISTTTTTTPVPPSGGEMSTTTTTLHP